MIGSGYRAAMICGRVGNRRSGVAVAMRHSPVGSERVNVNPLIPDRRLAVNPLLIRASGAPSRSRGVTWLSRQIEAAD